MWLKYPIIVLSFLFLMLLQNSFFTHIGILGVAADLVFILFFVLIFFEEPYQYSLGIFSALAAGFLLDAFSPFYFGTTIFSLLVTYFLFKMAMRLLKEVRGKYLLAYFIPIFLFFCAIYRMVLYLVAQASHTPVSQPSNILLLLAYNLAIALVGCLTYKIFIYSQYDTRQLSLFR